MKRVCYECGQELSSDAKTCTLCGATLLIQMPGFSEKYEAMEFLHSGKQSDVFVVRRRSDGEYLLAKFCQKKADADNSEDIILTLLNHPAIPKTVERIVSDDTICLIREYVHGASLDRLSFTLDEASILDISLQLCNILTYLHNLKPPVIHRDIKPHNIILGDDGNVHLIDFGISRKYSENALKDTEKIGTEGFMPPEQYGYRQTDCRADIYSMGILLCWLLTGQRNPDELAAPINEDIINVIRKCAAFAPDNRYSTVDFVKKDLLQISCS